MEYKSLKTGWTMVLLALVFLSCSNEKYVRPQKQNIKEVVFASGHIETEDQYLIIAAADGYIEKVLAEVGMVVSDGTLLGEIEKDAPRAQLNDALASYQDAKADMDPDSPKIQEMVVQIAVAQKELAQNEELLNSYDKLVQTKAVSKVDYENQLLKTENSRKDLTILKDSKENLMRSLNLSVQNANNLVQVRRDDISKYSLKATGRSQVLKTYHKEGEYIRRGETFVEMGKGTPIVKLFVEEGDINSIALGQKVALSVNTYEDRLFEGEITQIQPAFDEEEQSFIVEARFIETPERLFSGTQVQANIMVAQKENALVIPAKSLISGNKVMTKAKGLVDIELGVQHYEWLEVLSGLSEDDLIAVEGVKN